MKISAKWKEKNDQNKKTSTKANMVIYTQK